jgi:putative DNA primase/helicase
MARHDIAKLKERLPLADLIGDVVDLKKNGKEFKGLCPFHKEKTPSFAVSFGSGREFYYCAGCGAGGDHIQFIQEYYQLDFPEALERFAELAGGGTAVANDNAKQRHGKVKQFKVDEWKHGVAPASAKPPTTLYVNRDGEWIEQQVVAAWPYKDLDGNVLAYTCRVEFTKPDGSIGKDVIPVCWKTNTATGEEKFKQGALIEPRPLYGMELIDVSDDARAANIILVEGEKAADAGRRLLADYPVIVMTWPGGCKAVDKALWMALTGRKIVGWPDCDSQAYAENHPQAGQLKAYAEQPGMGAMMRIAQLTEQHGATMRIVAVPAPGGEWPNGYDLADLEADGWTGEQVMAYLKENIATPAEIFERSVAYAEQHQFEEVPLGEYEQYDHQFDDPANDNTPPPREERPTRPPEQRPFRILGWDRGRAFYLPDGIPQVTALVPGQHTKLNLLQLASLLYWKDNFPAEKRSGDGTNWDMAADALIQQAQRIGIWDPELIRGRGAWWDRGKWAVHLGNRVVLGTPDGEPEEFNLRDAPSTFVYEAGKPIKLSFNDPLGNADSVKLVQICERLRWERPISGKLLAGWVFLAPICGAIGWRPHIWITGGAGSGKTTVMVDIIGRCLDGPALKVEGDTSEAGIRQALLHDARPVVFDEFESERKKAAERVEDVLAMVTRASSETGADLLKGGADGRAASFKTRAMFAFASIGVNLRQHAARTRVTVLGLYGEPETPESLAEFKLMKTNLLDTLTENYIQQLQARAIRMIPVIRHNAQVFAEAAALALKDRRMGDQIGTLLAGAYGLHSTGVISREKAVEWIERQNWDEITETTEGNDEAMCLRHILSHIVRVETAQHGVKSRSIAELVAKAAGLPGNKDYEVSGDECRGTLLRMGIMATERDGVKVIRIASGHREMKRVLLETSWSESYPRTLQRIKGAAKLDARKFGTVGYRCTELAVADVMGD